MKLEYSHIRALAFWTSKEALKVMPPNQKQIPKYLKDALNNDKVVKETLRDNQPMADKAINEGMKEAMQEHFTNHQTKIFNSMRNPGKLVDKMSTND